MSEPVNSEVAAAISNAPSNNWSDTVSAIIQQSALLSREIVIPQEIWQLDAAPRYRESISEDETAIQFARAYAGQLRFDHTRETWFYWADSHWKTDSKSIVVELARRFVRSLAGHVTGKSKEAMGRAAFAERVERVARTSTLLAVDSSDWDADDFKLGTPDGTVNLKSGVLMPADPADLITKTALVSPSRTEDCPRWLKFLDEATRGDVELITFLKRFCGYSLTGSIREHKLAFIHGPGGNGKSVFANVVSAILGSYATIVPLEALTASKSPRHETEIALLAGSRLATATETEDGRGWAEARLKQLTGGDMLTARFMHQDYFRFRPTFKLLIIGNYKPELRNVDAAIRRRMNVVEFKHVPPVPDMTLEPKLIAEAPAILRWMINGAVDWQGAGLLCPKSVVDATATYLASQDTFGQWLAECCETDPTFSEPGGELWAAWEAYATSAGELPGSQKGFSGKLQSRGYSTKRTTGARLYVGLRLKIRAKTGK
jgi:putative DNA primase/helicase